ncbi:outer membrane beta-barrel protein [Vibrio lamellibrachiae]|uniref:outer membrane protein n=1 Tax=Vibrio lamellibrachiae TaxID=2910253 RepID=UPI003D1471DB
MKKVLLTLSIALATSPAAFATEFFIGGGAGYHDAKIELNDSEFGTATENANGASFHIRAGAYLTENHRVTTTINHMGDSNVYRNRLSDVPENIDVQLELAQTEYLISYDYIYSVGDKLSIFAGATAGIVNNKANGFIVEKPTSGDQTEFSHKGSESDFTYGLQVGTQYKIMNNMSLDLQYRHMFESYSHATNWSEGETTELSIPSHSELSVSLDYRF